MNIFDFVSPLDFRYYGADSAFFNRLRPYVSEDAYIKYQAKVERALVYALWDLGLCPSDVLEGVNKACEEITAEEVYEEEKKIEHVVRALANCIRRRVDSDGKRFIHLFATSNDITDTANALRLQELTRDIILPDLIALQEELVKRAREYAETPQIGRTHGKHAEPITFGFALALYVDRLGNRIKAIEEARQNLRGKFSGAVGAHNALSLQFPNSPQLVEKLVLAYLGLQPSDTSMSTQIVEPDYITDFAYSIISCFSVLANIADDIRHLHRSEIAEVQERYADVSVGSSTMPHKENPKNFEFVKSMWKAYMPRMITVLMDQISEHQRDLTNSASSRYIIELLTAFDYVMVRLTKSIKNLEIDENRMKQNLGMNKDAIIAEPLYILLSLAGHPDAYDVVRKLVAEAKKNKQKLTDIIWKDKEIQPFLAKLKEEHKALLQDPTIYKGDATERTIATCNYWEKEASELEKYLEEEREVLKSVKAERFSALHAKIRDAERRPKERKALESELGRGVSTERRADFVKNWIDEQKRKKELRLLK